MAKFNVGDKVYLRQGLERNEPREFTITETLTEEGVDYVRVDHPTCPEGAWEEKFFGIGSSPDNGRTTAIVANDSKPAPVDAGPNEKFYAQMDETLTLALGAWAQKDDAGAIELVTQVLETLRTMRETARGAKQ